MSVVVRGTPHRVSVQLSSGRFAARSTRRSGRRAGLSRAGAARPRRRVRRAALSQGRARGRHPADRRRGTDDQGRRGRQGRQAERPDRPCPPTSPFSCPCSANPARGLSQPLPADHEDEAARAQRRGRARRSTSSTGRPAGLVALAGRRRSTPGASASAGCSIGWSASSDAIAPTSSCSVTTAATRKPTNETLRAAGGGVPRADRRHQRRPLRDGAVERPLFDVLTCIHHHTDLAQAGRRLAPNAERYLKSPDEMAALFADRAGRGGPHARARRSPAVHDGRSRLPVSRLSGAAGRNAGVVSQADHRGRRARSLPAVSRPRPRADRARARSHREARSRRLLPDRLGHRQLLPPARHPRAGPRVGGQQRRVLQPRHHRGRSGRDGSAVRAVPVGGARRVAGHRSRSAERRSARARHPARLREVRRGSARR